MPRYRSVATWPMLLILISSPGFSQHVEPTDLEWIRVGDDGSHFMLDRSGQRFTAWGVNYDHDRDGRLLEDYWHDGWPIVVEDFREIKQLGANTVRIHLQLGKFMSGADRTHEANLVRLSDLVKLAEKTGLYLQLTGLGCYHKDEVPSWYDELGETERWKVQRRFWQAVAKVGQSSPAVFAYDLMNEPILPGQQPAKDWLAGEFGGKHFVQRISLDLAGRTRQQVAKAWIEELASAIREIDKRHMITVGVIPWAYVFKGTKPLFYAPEVKAPLDFVSLHFYPRQGEVAEALDALRVYDLGKPLVVQEIFPLRCNIQEAAQFIDGSRGFADGWISFYWGETIDELRETDDLTHVPMADWLQYFQSQSK